MHGVSETRKEHGYLTGLDAIVRVNVSLDSVCRVYRVGDEHVDALDFYGIPPGFALILKVQPSPETASAIDALKSAYALLNDPD